MPKGTPITEPIIRRALELYYKGHSNHEIHVRCGLAPNTLCHIVERHEKKVDAAIATVNARAVT